MDIVLLVAGILMAVYGAQFLVDGGTAIAKRFNIPTLVIGSTIVAFGTSMPEFTVNINAALNGNTDLAFGNVLGSNLFNICAIVGVVALIAPLAIAKDVASKDLFLCLLSAAAVGIAGNQIYIDQIRYHELFASSGLLFLMFFAIFMRYVYGAAVTGAGASHQAIAEEQGMTSGGDDEKKSPHPMLKATIYVILGLAGLVFGGEFIVEGASSLARTIGLSDKAIGLAIVGPGTSFPELIACIAAARRRDVGMVMGNVLGSNIFNIFFTLGATSLIMPIPLDLALNNVILINFAVTALLFVLGLALKGRPLGKPVGALLVVTYISYITYALMAQ
ncbi:sodium:calcium antiporter [Corallincola holothuriorum]|uniref:Sodium:calcium antiporter n=1 Tax=Corallincola holothuriorum TaxID=2282215 RepID=A0A368NK95_9GAMM|nr:calcium/sodium antiporter [Corallincola holothuriorum]RCU51027.1 sodium:calcium antiporter [Corallincola holothuriorum]